jgi:hypothetical protein
VWTVEVKGRYANVGTAQGKGEVRDYCAPDGVMSENSIALKTQSYAGDSEGRYAGVKKRFLAS